MFEWYRQAEVCYVYLSDVHRPLSEIDLFLLNESKWFTRGWTLQELLAPRWLEFYNSSWENIGTRSSLANFITQITGIDHLFNYEEASVAQKMSWVSRRKTTRLEDLSYCLMGLFNVHMPPLYGEGSKSFQRLQHEILKQSDDESILAWNDWGYGEDRGLLVCKRARNNCTFSKNKRLMNRYSGDIVNVLMSCVQSSFRNILIPRLWTGPIPKELPRFTVFQPMYL